MKQSAFGNVALFSQFHCYRARCAGGRPVQSSRLQWAIRRWIIRGTPVVMLAVLALAASYFFLSQLAEYGW
ncbi:MAG: hypothetical protein ABFS19_05065 [Thermodesulfobacteriota bacterium]